MDRYSMQGQCVHPVQGRQIADHHGLALYIFPGSNGQPVSPADAPDRDVITRLLLARLLHAHLYFQRVVCEYYYTISSILYPPRRSYLMAYGQSRECCCRWSWNLESPESARVCAFLANAPSLLTASTRRRHFSRSRPHALGRRPESTTHTDFTQAQRQTLRCSEEREKGKATNVLLGWGLAMYSALTTVCHATYRNVLGRCHLVVFDNSIVLRDSMVTVKVTPIYDTCYILYKPAKNHSGNADPQITSLQSRSSCMIGHKRLETWIALRLLFDQLLSEPLHSPKEES